MDKGVVLSKLANYFEEKKEVLFAYLFGSVARGRAGPLSDIDVAVFLAQKPNLPYGYKSEMLADLMRLLQDNQIDLVILNDASPFLRFQVIRYGELIFCRSHRARVTFHEKAFRDYQDILPLLRVQQEYLYKRIKEGRFGRPELGR